MDRNRARLFIVPLILLCCCQQKQEYIYPNEIAGIGMVVKAEMGFFQEKYVKYFNKRLNVDVLNKDEEAFANSFSFDENYVFANITMIMLYNGNGTIPDTVHLIYPIFLNSNQKSNDVNLLNSYVFNATLMPAEKIKASTLPDGCYYLVGSTWKFQPVYYPVRNYHVRFKNDARIKTLVDSLLSIVRLNV